MKRTITILILLPIMAIALFSCVSSNKLKEGWIHTMELKKKGYKICNSFKGWIHVRETNDSLESNIFKIKTL